MSKYSRRTDLIERRISSPADLVSLPDAYSRIWLVTIPFSIRPPFDPTSLEPEYKLVATSHFFGLDLYRLDLRKVEKEGQI